MASPPSHPPTVLEPALAGGLPGFRVRLEQRAEAWRTEATARRALTVSLAAALVLVLTAAAGPATFIRRPEDGFPGWMVGPFAPLASWLPDDPLFVGAAFSLMLAVMLAAYFVVLACARLVSTRWAIGTVVALHAIIMLAPPLALTDVFNYIGFARIGVLHGINPYIASPAEIPIDPGYDLASWRHGLSPYGPLFTVASYPLALLPIPVAHWLLKVVTAAASLGCLALVWRLAQRRGLAPLPAFLLVGLNPLVVVYGIGGVHNDFFMLAFILAGVAACLGGRPARTGAALAAAAGIKLSGGLLAPFALAATRDRRALLAGGVAAGAGLAALSVAAFGLHLPAVGVQSNLVHPQSLPNLLGLALGQGGATAPVRALVQLALGGVLVWLLVRTVRGADWLEMGGWATLALVLSLPWEMPWYVLWVLPLAALARSRPLRRAVLALSVFLLIASAPITGFLLADVCRCSPAATETGKRNGEYILRFLR